MYNFNWGANQGWICGSCGRSFAPHVCECPYCNKKRKTFATTTTFDDAEWWKGYLARGTADMEPILNSWKTFTISQKENL